MSSESESDGDYVPGEPEQLSEEDSADDETEKQYDKEVEVKNNKRKLKEAEQSKKRKKCKKSKEKVEITKEEDVEKKSPDPEQEKKREDDLWAKFLEGTDTKPKITKDEVTSVETEKDKPVAKESKVDKDKDDCKAREQRIFEFAGETLVVENNIIKEKIPTKVAASTASKPLDVPARRSGGLAGLLNQMDKKSKLSTLEKSKLDWETYKQQEGLEEEIKNHNKGKKGYLDRQDFLERSDMKQYEIERDLRMRRRSKR